MMERSGLLYSHTHTLCQVFTSGSSEMSSGVFFPSQDFFLFLWPEETKKNQKHLKNTYSCYNGSATVFANNGKPLFVSVEPIAWCSFAKVQTELTVTPPTKSVQTLAGERALQLFFFYLRLRALTVPVRSFRIAAVVLSHFELKGKPEPSTFL